jgi:outer membrane protein OmpA-like peptidoglycan-associated protein
MTPSIASMAALGLASLVLAGCATPPPPKPAPASYVVLLDNGDGTVGKVLVTGRQGVTTLEKVRESTLLAQAGGPSFVATEAQIRQDFGAALAISPKKPKIFQLNFQFGGAKLTPESERDLADVIAEIESREVPDISVIGHTDTVGNADQNYKVGLDRARLVGALLQSAKLSSANVTVDSHGEMNLLKPTADEVNEPANRRVEVTVR